MEDQFICIQTLKKKSNDHSVFKNTDTMKLSLFSSLESNVLKKVLCKW